MPFRRYLPDYYIDLETGSVQHRKHRLPVASLMDGFREMSPKASPAELALARRNSWQFSRAGSFASKENYMLPLEIGALHNRLTATRQKIAEGVATMSSIEVKERQQVVADCNSPFRWFALPGEVVQILRWSHSETKTQEAWVSTINFC